MCISLNMPAFPLRAALPAHWYPSQVSCINKSTLCLELWLSQNSFCVVTQKPWALLSPETRCVISAERLWVQVIWSVTVFKSQNEVCGFNYIPKGSSNFGNQNITCLRPYPWDLCAQRGPQPGMYSSCPSSLQCKFPGPNPSQPWGTQWIWSRLLAILAMKGPKKNKMDHQCFPKERIQW